MSYENFSITSLEMGLKELERAIECSKKQIIDRGHQNMAWEANNVLLCDTYSTWSGDEYYYNPAKDVIWSQSYSMHLDDGKDCTAPKMETEESLRDFAVKNKGDAEAVIDLLKLCREISASYREMLKTQPEMALSPEEQQRSQSVKDAINNCLKQIRNLGHQDIFCTANSLKIYSNATTDRRTEFYYNPMANKIWSQTYRYHLGRIISDPHLETENSLVNFIRKNEGSEEPVISLLRLYQKIAARTPIKPNDRD